MVLRRSAAARRTFFAILIFISPTALRLAGEEPTPQAVSAFNAYAASVEARLARQHSAPSGFVAGVDSDPKFNARLRGGEAIVEQMATSGSGDTPGALLRHWRGTAFVPGAKVAAFEQLLRDYRSYPQRFSPQVLWARVTGQHDGRLQVEMRVRQKHIIAVVMDTAYDVAFGKLDAQHGYSSSRSTAITEIDEPGTSKEHALSAEDEHGFLWRLNTYWTYEERDGGLYIQIESISLSRSIPTGLGWLIRPYVESVPRESVEFTLRSACDAMRGRAN